MNSENRLRFFIYVRIVVTFLFLSSTVILNLQSESYSSFETYQPGIIRLMLFSFLFSVISLFLTRLPRLVHFLTYLQVICDLLFVTILLLFTGGILSPYSFLYLLSIMIAGLLLGRREAIYTSSLCLILYGAIIDFQYFGYLDVIGLSSNVVLQVGASHVLYTMFFNIIGFFLAAFITGYLSERARLTEAELHQKNINYDELSQLNSTIVDNIETGLLTTNASGRIRVFNPYAETLTGISISSCYNSELSSVFPFLGQQITGINKMVTGEFEFISAIGLQIYIGYSAAPFYGKHSELAGFIFNFWDLSALRRLEDRLKKADRLAALGELSARMAHEIRNPLTALSGAVQLLSDHNAVSSEDRRLFNIVTRESDRLNNLISEFLAYARPALPVMKSENIFQLIEDLKCFLSLDSRFNGILIHNLIPSHLTLCLDVDQIKQVFINLLYNAADAMACGNIYIRSNLLLSGTDGFGKCPMIKIEVADSGSGIDCITRQHLFEPFWTTKVDGTGLGLAICYRIIQSHGGAIYAEHGTNDGSCFVILLPFDISQNGAIC